MRNTARRALALALLLAACSTQPRSNPRPTFDVDKIVPRELLRQANHGREVVGTDGRFVIPRGVRRAWIDVGAYLMETTHDELETHDDVALVAIEPLAECWKVWPDNPRLVALPVAISLERGWLDFNVNAAKGTSSLLKSIKGNSVALTRTVEVRKVPVVRLEDVLDRIPPEVDVEFVKTDVQGLDLQVLKSAGEALRRVKRVRAEVINEAIYEGIGELRPGTEAEFVAYMASKGFQFVGDDEVSLHRAWLDKQFVNGRRMGWLWRARRRIGSLFS
jgi:FkbM family methyltransferase